MEHEDYVCNYRTGSSKATKTSAALDMINQPHIKSIGVEFIVYDNDIIMRAHSTHVGIV